MPGDKAFQVEGSVIEALPGGVYRAELANGHRLTAFVAGRAGILPGWKETISTATIMAPHWTMSTFFSPVS